MIQCELCITLQTIDLHSFVLPLSCVCTREIVGTPRAAPRVGSRRGAEERMDGEVIQMSHYRK
jgi:hypothetical protein